jgi:TRAP-type mannitol/chloroaromatic compound transport system permease small subunit
MSEARLSPTRAPALARAVDRLFIWPGYLAGGLYFVLAFFVTYDALARKWGGAVGLPTTRVTDEISGYLLALAATWGAAFTLRMGGHVRVDVMFPYMARAVRRAADVLAQLLMAGFASLVAWKIWALVADSLETDARSSTYLLTPLYIPQGILGIGFTLLALAAAFTAVAVLAGWEGPDRGAAGPQA